MASRTESLLHPHNRYPLPRIDYAIVYEQLHDQMEKFLDEHKAYLNSRENEFRRIMGHLRRVISNRLPGVEAR